MMEEQKEAVLKGPTSFEASGKKCCMGPLFLANIRSSCSLALSMHLSFRYVIQTAGFSKGYNAKPPSSFK